MLLDEYQDTSSAQALLLRELFSGPTPGQGRGHPVKFPRGPGRRTWLLMHPSWSSSAPPRASPLAWTDFREASSPRVRVRLRMLLRAASFAPPAPFVPPWARTDPRRAVRQLKKVVGAYLSLPVLRPSRSEVVQ